MAKAASVSESPNTQYRFTAVVDDEMYHNVRYWANKRGISVNDLLRDRCKRQPEHLPQGISYIARANKDYDLPTLEVQRLNQLIDGFNALSSNINSLEKIVTSGFDSLVSLTRGDNYLLEDDDGDIDD